MNHRMTVALMTRVLLASTIMLGACSQQAAEQTDTAVGATAAVTPVTLTRTPSPRGASVHFITPADGETVSNPVRITFGIRGMTVVKAGDKQPDSGHHHLLIDTGMPNPGLPIPADGHHVHFGDGSTKTEITLAPGEHTLQMLLGDYLHIPHDPPVVSAPITISVE